MSALNFPIEIPHTQQLAHVKIGLVGYGYWGPKLARNFHELSEAKLSAVCDLRQDYFEAIRTLYPETIITHEFQDLLTSDLNAIAIATPVKTHYPLARAALEAGKHVLIEKPIAASSREAKELIALAHRQNLVLMVGHTFEYHPAVEAIKSIIQSGELGKIHYIDSTRGNFGKFRSDVNVIWDLATHDLSIFRYILDREPLSIGAHGQTYVQPQKGLQDVASLALYFPQDILVTLRVSWLEPIKVRRLTIVGSHKILLYDDTAEHKIVIHHKKIYNHCFNSTPSDFSHSNFSGETTIYPLKWIEPLKAQTQHFIDCILGKNRVKSNGEIGLKIVKMLEATDLSLLNHGATINL